MRKIFFFLLLLFSFKSYSQQDSATHLQISVITCAPGNDLYSIFGHTAIRIIDSTNHTDLFYNYGTFDFSDPDFYSKFVRGKLNYFLNIDNANDFFASYLQEGRTIYEQILHLTNQQKQTIQQYLINNLSGNNKYYKYDFLFDNCTTRARDVLTKNTGFTSNWQLVAQGTTFRNMLYQYLDSAGACWSKLGIDILLGIKIDVPVTMEQSTFLPDYFMHSVDSFNTKNIFVADRKKYEASIPATEKDNHQPLIIFSFLAVIVVALANIKHKVIQTIFRYYAIFIVFVTGLLGCLLLFMWFGTDHKSCAANYNLLWALPTNIIACFLVNKKTNYAKNYFLIGLVISGLTVVFWFLLPQQFNVALFPFVFSNMFCYKALWQNIKTKMQVQQL
ncbi:MAG: DUF4105 domain-containing protein [Bacteroidetes bacterium]|nr:DUF4105 domain-containing protein [Bacteroidota bacterium]